jgi:6-pyruvoyl tetrahydropterin synthase/QueD family protein
MFEIEVTSSFSATHRIQYPSGEWEATHGHDWNVTLTLAAPALDEFGMVADFEAVRRRLNEITRELHHKALNDHPWFGGMATTAENVAKVVFERLAAALPWGSKAQSLRVEEAPGCFALFVRSR